MVSTEHKAFAYDMLDLTSQRLGYGSQEISAALADIPKLKSEIETLRKNAAEHKAYIADIRDACVREFDMDFDRDPLEFLKADWPDDEDLDDLDPGIPATFSNCNVLINFA